MNIIEKNGTYHLKQYRRFIVSPLVFVIITMIVFLYGYAIFSDRAYAKPAKAVHSQTILEMKITDDSDLVVHGNTFTGKGDVAINDILSKAKIQKTKSLFDQDKTSLKEIRKNLQSQNIKVADLSQYYQIRIADGQDIVGISNKLKALPDVEYAYPQSLPVASPTTPNLQNLQFHRQAAPRGVDSDSVATWPGAKGGRVKVVDVEYSWNVNHEDLAKARASGALLLNGIPQDPFYNTNHGTGVLGILSATANTFGVTGEVPDAQLAMVNANTTTEYNPANAINIARQNMTAGDVMLIEMQADGPSTSVDGDYVPLEWIPSVYEAIKYATSTNITVVEAAGNGNQNLDDTTLFGSSFPSGQSDSGAIIVGAGGACTSGPTPLNARMSFSTYGTRVNLHAAGECVVTTGGDGDLYFNSLNENYTNSFAGTSSASAIIAGTAAAYNSAYKQLNGSAPTSDSVRSALIANGTKQNTAAGTYAGSIGPMPNLKKAILLTDRTAPTAPKSVVGTLVYNRPKLTWVASTDNVGVASYSIYRNNVFIKSIAPGTTYTDTTASSGVKKYYVKAVDKAGRYSTASNSVYLTVR